MTTAYDLYDAAFDSAQRGCYSESNIAEYVKQYADGAMNIFITDDVAEKISECRKNFIENGDGSCDFDYMVRFPLQEIDI